MGRALLVLMVAIGTALVVFWLAAPRLLSTKDVDSPAHSQEILRPESPPAPAATAAAAEPDASTEPGIAPPLTREEREYADIEARRAPFYDSLRRNYSFITVLRPAPGDQTTIEVYLNQTDTQLVPTLVYDAIAPYAKRYGFRRARFYMPNPPGSVERYRLDSEATQDSGGGWNTFRK